MRFFRKYIFPALYGLLAYFTIRLLHDTDISLKFWERPILTNIIEIGTSIITGYLVIALFKWLLRNFQKRWVFRLNYQTIAKEIVILVAANLVLVNIIFLPVSANTDDGLSWDDVVFMNTIPAFYAIMYYGIVRCSVFFNAYVNEKLKFEKITITQLETELKFLKAQYHPHFLFNALNTIYFQMDKDMEGAKLSIERFSGLLRYQLYDQQHQVPVSQEINYLQSFIELQRIRTSRKLNLATTFDPALSSQLIYPLLFLPLVENAFKYVGGNYELSISAALCTNTIIFKVVNSTGKAERLMNEAGGIGLENLKRRLDLLYPGKHNLQISKGAQLFIAEIKIEL